MDIKDLNKGQFILLIILVCFVVSIATSITTYSLLREAPESVIKPITKVVQNTVEHIVEIQKGEGLTPDEEKLLADLKALKPLIDKLANESKEENNTIPITEIENSETINENNIENTNSTPSDTNSNPAQ